MLQSLKNFSIKKKITVGFAVPIALIVCLSLIVFYSNDKRSTFAALLDQASSLKHHELETRKYEKNFLLHKDTVDINHLQSNLTTMKNYISILKEHSWDSTMVENLLNVEKSVLQYDTLFKEVVQLWKEKGLNENEGLRGIFRRATHDMESLIKDRDLPAEVTAQLLMCRRREKDYIIRGDMKYVDKLAKDVTTLKTILDTAGAPDLHQNVDTYQENFLQMVEVDKKINNTITLFKKEINTLEPIIDKVVLHAKEEISNAEQMILTILLSATILTILLSLIVGGFIGRLITNPIDELMKTIISLGDKNLTNRSTIVSQDEIGKMALATNNSIDSIRSIFTQLQKNAKTITTSSNDLTSITQKTTKSVKQLQGVSSSIQQSTKDATNDINDIVVSTNDMNESLEFISIAVKEMGLASNEISHNCHKGSEVANIAHKKTTSTNDLMKKLEMSAQEIGKILDVIKDIADQTNLLALNATIEAASAGEAGKGFAVVANEVKELAKQTAQATEEIETKIVDMRQNTDNSVKAIEGITEVVDEVNNISQIIASAVEEQSSSINNISESLSGVNNASENVQKSTDNLRKISNGINEFNKSIGGISDSIHKVEDKVSQFNGMAEELRNTMNEFKV